MLLGIFLLETSKLISGSWVVAIKNTKTSPKGFINKSLVPYYMKLFYRNY